MDNLNPNLFSFTPLNDSTATPLDAEDVKTGKKKCGSCRRTFKNKETLEYHMLRCNYQQKREKRKSISAPRLRIKDENYQDFEFFTHKNLDQNSEERLVKAIEKKLGLKTTRYEVVNVKEENQFDEDIKPCIRKQLPKKTRVKSKNIVRSLSTGILERKQGKKKQTQHKDVPDLPVERQREHCITLRAKTTNASKDGCNFMVTPDDSHLEDFIIDDVFDFPFESDNDIPNVDEYPLMVQNVETVEVDVNDFNGEVLEDIFATLDEGNDSQILLNTDDLSSPSGQEKYETLKQDFDNQGKEIEELKSEIQTKDNFNDELEKRQIIIEEENSNFKLKQTELETLILTLKSSLAEKDSLIVNLEKLNLDIKNQLEENEEQYIKEKDDLKNDIILKKKLIEIEQEKSSALELKVINFENDLHEKSRKIEGLEKEKSDLFKEIRKTSELQMKVRKLKAQRYAQHLKEKNRTSKTPEPVSTSSSQSIQKEAEGSQGIFLKTFSSLTATSENINSIDPKQAETTSSDLVEGSIIVPNIHNSEKGILNLTNMESRSKQYQTHLDNFHQERKLRRKEIEGKLRLYKKQKEAFGAQLEGLKDNGDRNRITELKKELSLLLKNRNTSVVEFKMIEKQHEIAFALYKDNYTSYIESSESIAEDDPICDPIADVEIGQSSIETQETELLPVSNLSSGTNYNSYNSKTSSRDPRQRSKPSELEEPLSENEIEILPVGNFIDPERSLERSRSRNETCIQEVLEKAGNRTSRRRSRSTSPSLESVDIPSSISRRRTRSISRSNSRVRSRSKSRISNQSRTKGCRTKKSSHGSKKSNQEQKHRSLSSSKSRSMSRSKSRYRTQSRSMSRRSRPQTTKSTSESRKKKPNRSSCFSHRNRSYSPYRSREHRSRSR